MLVGNTCWGYLSWKCTELVDGVRATRHKQSIRIAARAAKSPALAFETSF